MSPTKQSPLKQLILFDEAVPFNGRLLRCARNDILIFGTFDYCFVQGMVYN